ncbi:MAG: ATP-binding protein, partial [Thermoplasmata archaeon]
MPFRKCVCFGLLIVLGLSSCAVQPSAQEKSIRIQLHSPNSVEMNCDPGEIEIVLNNLISNAVKYNRDNGQVDIDIWNEENKVTIAVKDTG